MKHELYFRNFGHSTVYETGRFDKIKKENGRSVGRSSYVVVDKASNFRAYADAMLTFVEDHGKSAYDHKYNVKISFSQE